MSKDLMEGFETSTDIQLRFRDLDMIGHVNNAVYMTWMELGRMAYTDKYLPNIDWSKEGFLLANVNMDFMEPVLLDEKVKVYMKVVKMGSKSFTFDCLITHDLGQGERPAAKGSSIVVTFNFETNRSMPIPQHWKEAMPGGWGSK